MVREGVMAWIRIHDTFEYSPRYGVTQVYRPGVYNVPQAAAVLAIAAGKAVRLRKASRDAEPTVVAVETRERVEDGWVKVERVGEPVFLKGAPPTDVGGADGDA